VGERAFPHGGAGLAALCGWLLSIAGEAGAVAVAIEVPHGPVMDALLDRDFAVHAIDPKQLDRLRDRFGVAGAKDDRRDARVAAAGCVGPTSHVLDWFHLAMRIHHVAQAAKGWSAATPAGREEGARLADAVERVRWRLWHGQARRALDLVGGTLARLDGMAEAAPAASAKMAVSLRALETYVSGQSDLVIDYAKARRIGEPISTATTEGTVQWLPHRRMGASQQMRWSPRGAHRMLKVRTAVANGTLAEDHLAAERWARRPFRPAA
jgi:Transposase